MVQIDRYGRIKNPDYKPRPLSGLQRTVREHRHSNIWNKFDDLISDIGRWFEINGEDLAMYLAWGLVGISVILFLIWIIMTWIDDGFFSALISGVIGGVVGYYAVGLGIGLIVLAVRGVCWVVSLVFRNATWFLLSIVAAALIVFLS